MRLAGLLENLWQVPDLIRGRSPLNFRLEEEPSVNKAIRKISAGLISTGLALGLAGCTEESSTKSQTDVKTPEGRTTVTEKTTVSKSGNNPPPVNEPVKNP